MISIVGGKERLKGNAYNRLNQSHLQGELNEVRAVSC